jgi:hypothetical protein
MDRAPGTRAAFFVPCRLATSHEELDYGRRKPVDDPHTRRAFAAFVTKAGQIGLVAECESHRTGPVATFSFDEPVTSRVRATIETLAANLPGALVTCV